MSEFTTDELAAIAYWPFPPPEGYIFDHEQLDHWVHDVLLFQPPSDRANGGRGRAEAPEIGKSRFIALATASMIGGVVTDQRFAERLGDGDVAGKTATTNAARVATFVDGLIASPPVVELTPPPPFGAVVVIPIPVPVPTPVPPEWGPDEHVTGRDLLSAGVRLHAAGRQISDTSLQEHVLAAAERLIDVGRSRLASVRGVLT